MHLNRLPSNIKNFVNVNKKKKILFFTTSRTKSIIGTIPYNGNGVSLNQFAEQKRSFDEDSIASYAHLINDFNPIHLPKLDDKDDNNMIVHGMLVASIFSSIIGTLIPGAIYRSQNITFHSSVLVNEIVIGRVDVTKLRVITKENIERILMTCKTAVRKEKIIDNHEENNDTKKELILCVTGEAKVLLPSSSYVSEWQV